MATQQSPGVFITEYDASIVVPNAKTAVAVFGGEFTKGMSEKYTWITNSGELIEYFGYPTNSNYNDWFQVYNYLQYGSNIYVSRAVDKNGTFSYSGNKIAVIDTISQIEIDSVPTDVRAGSIVRFGDNGEDEYQVKEVIAGNDAVRQVDTVTINSAVDGDYTVYLNGSPITYTANANTVDEIAVSLGALIENADASYTNVTNITGGVITVEATTAGVPQTVSISVGDMTADNVTANVEAQNYILEFEKVNGQDVDFSLEPEAVISELIYIRDGAYNAFAEAPMDGGTAIPANVLYKDRLFIPNNDEYEYLESSIVVSPTSKLKFIAKDSGDLMNGVEIAIAREADFASGTQTVFNSVYLNDLFEFAPKEAASEFAVIIRVDGFIESAYIVSSIPGAMDYKNKTLYVEDYINLYSKYVYCKDNISLSGLPDSRLYTAAKYDSNGVLISPAVDNILYLSNGSDGTVSHGDIIDSYGSVDDNTIFGEEHIEIDLVISNERSRTAAVNLVNGRKDCIAFHGMLYEDSVGLRSTVIVENAIKDVTTGEMNLSSSYNAYYGNYKLQYDKFNDKNRWVNVAGDIAGLFAATAEDYESWWATAGETRGKIQNAIKLSYNPNRGHRDLLYKNKINPIASFPGIGNAVVYGQKTLLDSTSAFSRLNVRSLFNSIERSISKYAKNHLFEINDDYERNKFVSRVAPFLETVKAKRGIYEFDVVCDTTNNTGQTIDNNEFVGDIFVKPSRTIEFIKLNFVAVGTDVAFDEVYI